MENFKQIAEKCLAGELSGRFVCRDGLHISSFTLSRTDNPLYPYKLYRVGKLTIDGHTSNKRSHNDIIQFIPYEEMKQEQIKIDIPEGKVPIMEQTENGVVITWANKDITYKQVFDYLNENHQLIQYQANMMVNKTDSDFLRKVNVIGKLTNIRNYFGKPSKENGTCGWVIRHDGTVCGAVAEYAHLPVFLKKEHAEQAIKMLGDELKYLFEPW
jgi:hypothetical protein